MAATNAPTNAEKEQIFGMAEKEMEYRVDLFNRSGRLCLYNVRAWDEAAVSTMITCCLGKTCIQSKADVLYSLLLPWLYMATWQNIQSVEIRLTATCFEKCIEKRYKESELNMGENSCIDRCVSKYWQVTNLIGQLLGSNRPPV